MTTLNFAPPYERWLREGSKTTTLRLGHRLKPGVGEIVEVTVGLADGMRKSVGRARIIQVKYLSLAALTDDDLQGESPDCRTVESAGRVLCAIYDRDLDPNEALTLIRFQPL